MNDDERGEPRVNVNAQFPSGAVRGPLRTRHQSSSRTGAYQNALAGARASVHAKHGKVILTFASEDEEGGDWVEGDSHLVARPGNLVAVELPPRGREWSILSEWPPRRDRTT